MNLEREQDLGIEMQLTNYRTFWFHCSCRFSGRRETIVWLTESDNRIFNRDAVRVPKKCPRKKHFKGPSAGNYSCNPLGKNPARSWGL